MFLITYPVRVTIVRSFYKAEIFTICCAIKKYMRKEGTDSNRSLQ
jgi:hypothetical protein